MSSMTLRKGKINGLKKFLLIGGRSCAAEDHEVQSPGRHDLAFLQTQFPQQFLLTGKAHEIEVKGF
jgi:hypothetical protein